MARILVVEDHEDIRMLVRVVLEEAGHRVTEAATGAGALDAVRRHRPDLVLLDMTLPDTDGLAVLEAIRSMPARASTPVVVVSGRSEAGGMAREAAGGAIDHVLKPFSPAILLEAVRRALAAAPADVAALRGRLERSATLFASVHELRVRARREP